MLVIKKNTLLCLWIFQIKCAQFAKGSRKHISQGMPFSHI